MESPNVRDESVYPVSKGVVALAIGLAWLGTACNGASAEAPAAPAEAAPIPVDTLSAEAVRVPLTLELEGTLEPNRHARLSPLVAGHVSEIRAELGDTVEANAPLVVLRSADFRLAASAASARAEAQLRSLGVDDPHQVDVEAVPSVVAAQSDLTTAEDALRRLTPLHQSGAVDDQTFEQATQREAAARARYDSARQAVAANLASYQSLRSEAALRRSDATNATLRAPFAGSVSARLAEVGEFVGPQTPVVELVDASQLRLTLQVPERFVTKVHEGQRVQVTIDGTDLRREGVVRHLAAAIDSARRTLTVEVMVPNEDFSVRAGHFARARIDLGEERELVSVPSTAVSERAGVYRVYAIVDGIAEARIVRVVERDGDLTRLEGDLRSGETVVSAPPRELADGVRVRSGVSAMRAEAGAASEG
ncbi:MAG: efflux RND transporter periplasmic adaptor subunit [Sandaracinus sp.]|nr:efflux RND transporter periplasmic adaptor subunit [Sandaracinus sp.]